LRFTHHFADISAFLDSAFYFPHSAIYQSPNEDTIGSGGEVHHPKILGLGLGGELKIRVRLRLGLRLGLGLVSLVVNFSTSAGMICQIPFVWRNPRE